MFEWSRSHLVLRGGGVRYGDVQRSLENGYVGDAEGLVLKTRKKIKWDEKDEEQ